MVSHLQLKIELSSLLPPLLILLLPPAFMVVPYSRGVFLTEVTVLLFRRRSSLIVCIFGRLLVSHNGHCCCQAGRKNIKSDNAHRRVSDQSLNNPAESSVCSCPHQYMGPASTAALANAARIQGFSSAICPWNGSQRIAYDCCNPEINDECETTSKFVQFCKSSFQRSGFDVLASR